MTFLKPLLLATIISVAAAAAEDECPFGWLPNYSDGLYCCSGNMVVDELGAYCCVYDMRPYKAMLTNTASLYATPTETATTFDDSCFATVSFTVSDYSAQVSSAAKRAETTPTDGSASEITSTSKVTSTSITKSGASSGTAAQTSTISTSTATATAQNVVLGGAAFAAGNFML